jgi:predicted RNase H-like nuclease
LKVLGVDGCRGGWIAVALEDGCFVQSWFVPRFAELLNDDAQVIGVDIPLGDTTPGRRAAESAARKALGSRGVCVFTPPPLACAEASTYDEAKEIAHAITGKGISQQAWNLLSKMVEASESWIGEKRVYEVHPECCFLAMQGTPVLERKKSWNGTVARLRLLRDVGIDLTEGVHDVDGARHDDVIDAAAAAWSAHRIATDSAQTFPATPERDRNGRAVAIWY